MRRCSACQRTHQPSKCDISQKRIIPRVGAAKIEGSTHPESYQIPCCARYLTYSTTWATGQFCCPLLHFLQMVVLDNTCPVCYASFKVHIFRAGCDSRPAVGNVARTVRERKLNRCNSDTDSKVWMEEEFCGHAVALRPECILRAFLEAFL